MEKRRVYDVWRDYDDFIRSLHLDSANEQEINIRKRKIDYLKKLLVIFIASFFTTLTFHFFITPNNLFNSGINGIIQVLAKYYCSKNNISGESFAIIYFASVFLVNAVIVSAVHWFYPGSIEMNSTAIFYVLFQFIWSSIFKFSALQKYMFNRLAPDTWSNLSNKNQLGLTLPFYITIGLVSSIIHTYGYSLIYQVKSTPGGLEIITSTLSQNQNAKKRKISIGNITKIFGILVIFFITVFNFIVVEDNIDLKKNELINFIDENVDSKKRIRNSQELNDFLEKWVSDKNRDKKILNMLKNWSNDKFLGDDPQRIFSHLKSKEDLLNDYKAKKKSLLDDQYEEIIYFEMKIKDLETNTYTKDLLGYLKYITNDEKLWASIVYIFFSSYLINQIFPKSKLVHLIAKVNKKENLEKVLKVLMKYEPVYLKSFSPELDFNEESYIVSCSITKWNYQLLSNELFKLGKILISEINESN